MSLLSTMAGRCAAIVALLVPLFSFVTALDVGDWVPYDDDASAGLGRFDNTDYAFDVAENLAYCRMGSSMMKLDPSVDDYGPLIEEALNKLHDNGGGTLRFGNGTYYVKTQFHIPSLTCMQGAGMYDTVLKVHKDAPEFPKAGMMRTVHTKHVSLFDFMQDGNRDELPGSPEHRYGIYTHLANKVWMRNVAIMNNKWYGFDPHGANTAWSYYLVMEDCYSAGNGKDGFTIDQYYYVSLLNSYAENNDRHGINVVSGSRYVLIKGNKVRDHPKCSLTVQNNEFGTQHVRFVDNVGVGHGLGGVCVRGTYDVQAFGNKFYSSQPSSSAFQLQNVWDCTLADNEWVRTTDKLISGGGTNEYDICDTAIVNETAAVRARYDDYFKDVGAAPAQLVDITDDTYGSAVTDNSAPKCPPRLQTRNGATDIVKLTPRKRTHDQINDAKSNNPSDSDAKCETGVREGVYCCAASCGSCERANCAAKGPECCPDSIRIDASSCDTFGPPCLMSRKYLAKGRLYGSENTTPDAVFPENADLEARAPLPAESVATPPAEPTPEKMAEPTSESFAEATPEKTLDPSPEKEDMPKPDDDGDDGDEAEERELQTKKLADQADPECARGVRNSKTCCPAYCGKCGGSGCSERGSDKTCCQSKVKTLGRVCSEVGAPCMFRS